MVKQIVLSYEKRQEIAATFKVSRQTVWAALSYRTNSRKANMLRAVARERGGVEVDFKIGKSEGSKFDTYWSEVPHQMVQVFSDRVRLVADIKSSTVTIERDGEIVRTFENATWNQLPTQQAEALKIVQEIK